jgi:ribosome biogenesis protein Tsr3
LIQIRHEVTPKWYQFGLAVGINKETLDEFSNFTPEECIVEISDLWLRTSGSGRTWRDVASALEETGCHRLAEKILKVYKTGDHYHAVCTLLMS